jgi:macrolide transport system ATP-binding/permease protein
LVLHNVSRRFDATPPVDALRDVSLTVDQGEFVAIEGPSGGGKSTLLNIVGLLDAPTSGSYRIGSTDFSSSKDAAETRSDYFAFIFQSFHLLDRRRVIDSVELGLLYRAIPRAERRARALKALRDVGLERASYARASTLSGGERQRVAIARALASNAPIVIADEPTGNLDSVNSQMIVDNLVRLNARGSTIVLVTHSEGVAAHAGRRVAIIDGRITHQKNRPASSVLKPETLPETEATLRLPPGRASRVRISDLWRDALANVMSRPARSAGLIGAVAVAVALTVVTAGLSQSARAQVSATFSAQENREVGLLWTPDVVADQPPQSAFEVARKLGGLNGVEAAAVAEGLDAHNVQSGPNRDAFAVGTFAVTSDFVKAARLRIDWAPGHTHALGQGEAIVGGHLANQVSLGPLDGSPTIFVDGRPVLAAGVIAESDRVPEYMGALILPSENSTETGAPTRFNALVLTRAGAAQQVAREAPLVVTAAVPEKVEVTAPVDPNKLRGEIEGNVQSALLALTGIALLAAVAGLTNAMMLGVIERKQEFGLRRALGARRRHVGALIGVESMYVGLLGGVAGLAFGMSTILAITITRHWAPIFDLRYAPAAVLGGIAIGVIAGILAFVRASLVQPSEALRL